MNNTFVLTVKYRISTVFFNDVFAARKISAYDFYLQLTQNEGNLNE